MSSDLELAHVIIEPSRMNILLSLSQKPKYISQIAETIKVDRSTVSYHLGVLEKNGIISSEYKILVEPKSTGKAARVYHINRDRLLEALREMEQILPQLKSIEG